MLKFLKIALVIMAVLIAVNLYAYSDGPAVSDPFARQKMVLCVAAAVYALLQGVKKFVPVTGFLAVAVNVAFSIFGVITLVQPEQLWSMQTAVAILQAVLISAGVHGTVRSFKAPPAS
ncbi:MAG: hypothetical protein LAP21_08445 [Acidobacteriia bacterium]|nr:hypothetical protein [Terriglobia bacterium]